MCRFSKAGLDQKVRVYGPSHQKENKQNVVTISFWTFVFWVF